MVLLKLQGRKGREQVTNQSSGFRLVQKGGAGDPCRTAGM